MNVQLYGELQTIKHLSSSSPTKKQSVVTLRPRTVSEYKSPTKSLRQSQSSEYSSSPKESSIECDATRLVHSLTMENRNLVERIAHLETVGFYQRQKLEASNCLSLAAEMEQLNVDEVLLSEILAEAFHRCVCPAEEGPHRREGDRQDAPELHGVADNEAAAGGTHRRLPAVVIAR